jgi:hypothetical protein
MPGFIVARLRASWVVLALILAACNGTAVVTLTSTPSTDNFLAYRVGLTSVQLQNSSGSSSLKILPAGTTVDFVNLLNFSEVLGAVGVAKGSYTSAVMTLDYTNSQIVYDDGSLEGVALTPLNASGAPAGQISVTATLDTTTPFKIALKQSAALAIVFDMGASNLVNLTNKTVTITPLMGASANPIDGKQVRIRGPITGVNATNLSFTSGVEPFDANVLSQGTLSITPSDLTTYEINGQPSIGSAGGSGLSSVGSNTLAVSYGTLSATDTITDTTAAATSASNVTFNATQVLAGSSVQAAGVDRVTGVVTSRSGNVLSVEAATLVGADGSDTFIPDATIITVGANTVVTTFGQTGADFLTTQQISVGAVIDAFGTATTSNSGTASLDATAGRVRVDPTTVSALVTAANNNGVIDVNLGFLGGRSISAFDFVGAGVAPAQFSVAITALDVTNISVGAPVQFSGFTNAFGAAPPNFTATAPAVAVDPTTGILESTTANVTETSLPDPTIVPAQLVIDWGSGTAAPFISFTSSTIDLDVHNANIGTRHKIQVGPQFIDVTGLSQDPMISPNASTSAQLFSIGHAVSSTVESFNTYAAFITQLQTELNGTVLATALSATGNYTSSSFAFSATSIALFLNN